MRRGRSSSGGSQGTSTPRAPAAQRRVESSSWVRREVRVVTSARRTPSLILLPAGCTTQRRAWIMVSLKNAETPVRQCTNWHTCSQTFLSGKPESDIIFFKPLLTVTQICYKHHLMTHSEAFFYSYYYHCWNPWQDIKGNFFFENSKDCASKILNSYSTFPNYHFILWLFIP